MIPIFQKKNGNYIEISQKVADGVTRCPKYQVKRYFVNELCEKNVFYFQISLLNMKPVILGVCICICTVSSELEKVGFRNLEE